MNETTLTDSCELPSWAWIRFIPVKLHIAGLWSGAGIGYLIDKELGTEWFFSCTLGIAAGGIGCYFQVMKEQARAISICSVET